jgi:PLP dependent protein
VVRLALQAGLRELGENYAQELTAKAAAVHGDAAVSAGAEPRWHFIGGLQRNKVKQVAALVSLWQSVDRVELGTEIARRRPGAEVLIQVNTTGEAAKAGCPLDDAPALADRLRAAGLSVRGLMTVGPTDQTVDPRPAFAALRSLVDRLGLEVCSMGMSGDLDAAVAEGTTMVRVGTALFGPRTVQRASDSSVG